MVKGLNSGAWISLPGCAMTTLRLVLQRAVVQGQAPFETATQPSAMAVWCLGSRHEIIGSHLESLEGGNLPPVTPIGQSKGGVALGSAHVQRYLCASAHSQNGRRREREMEQILHPVKV